AMRAVTGEQAYYVLPQSETFVLRWPVGYHGSGIGSFVHTMRGAAMSRLLLAGFVSSLILGPASAVRADEAEDKAVAFVKGLGGKVTRDEKLPGKPVISVSLTIDPLNIFSTEGVTDEG